jgi:excisionase family DNA binding protein
MMWTLDQPRPSLGVKDLSAQMKIGVSTIYRLIKEDPSALPKGYRVGGQFRWTPESVDAWIAAQDLSVAS